MSEIATRLTAALADRYRIERELGAGGMATVYLAEDLKHKRKVALKVLKPELAAVLGAERFVQEITTTASLQHPHILPLFDSGTADGFLYYVMPFIQGETLRDKLNRETQLGVDEAVRIAIEVADALHYAHSQGVIHRDIKPENILLANGRPMVADFGIALAVSAAAGGRMTETGLSLGTPHYMSPEQATADKELTARSDIYSLATVLYEMLAGDPPHTANSAQAVIMKIITDVARPVSELRRTVPPNVDAAVAKALEKLPADRFENARAFAGALASPAFTIAHPASAVPDAAALVPLRRATVGFAALAAVALVAAVWGWMRPPPKAETPAMRVQIAFGPGERLHTTVRERQSNAARPSRTAFAFSPDGRLLVYVGDSARLYVRPLGGSTSSAIPGTAGAESPFFSYDGRSIGFWSDGVLRRVSLAGGPPTDLLKFGQVNGASWSEDDRIAVSSQSAGLVVVSATGATPPDTVAEPGAILPQFLPGGRALLFTTTDFGFNDASAFRVEWLSLDTRERRVLIRDAADARVTPNGYLIFARRGAVLGVRFDPANPAISTAPFTVLENVMQSLNGNWSFNRTGAMQLAFSPLGQLAWLEGGMTPDGDGELSWLDRQGRRTPIRVADTRGNTAVRLSPDESKVAITRIGSQLGLTIVDLRQNTTSTLSPARPVHWPLWSPDGSRLIAGTADGDSSGMVWLQADDSRPAEWLPGKPQSMYAAFWSPDGTEFIAHRGPLRPRSSSAALLAMSLSSGAVREISNLPSGGVLTPAISPNGKWLAYTAIVAGADTAIFLQPWPALDRRWKIADRGTSPAWTRGGREIVFTLSAGVDSVGGLLQHMMAVEISDGPDPKPSSPRELFTARMNPSLPLRGYDVNKDGSRFYVMSRSQRQAPPGALNLTINWFQELERLAALQKGRP